MRLITRLLWTLALVLGLGTPASAQPFFFTTGNPDGRIGVASRPESADGSKSEIEAADDFILSAAPSACAEPPPCADQGDMYVV